MCYPARELGERRVVEGDRGGAARDGFQDGNTEPLVVRGIDEHIGGIVRLDELLMTGEVAVNDAVGNTECREPLRERMADSIRAKEDKPMWQLRATCKAGECLDEIGDMAARRHLPDEQHEGTT